MERLVTFSRLHWVLDGLLALVGCVMVLWTTPINMSRTAAMVRIDSPVHVW